MGRTLFLPKKAVDEEIAAQVQGEIDRQIEQSKLLLRELKAVDPNLTLVLVNENADPDVRHDLERFFARLAKDGDPLFRHRSEGPDDMPAHVRAALTATQLAIPIRAGRLVLGTWQGIYLWEHRLRGHERELAVHVLGE